MKLKGATFQLSKFFSGKRPALNKKNSIRNAVATILLLSGFFCLFFPVKKPLESPSQAVEVKSSIERIKEPNDLAYFFQNEAVMSLREESLNQLKNDSLANEAETFDAQLKNKLEEILADSPMEQMTEILTKQDRRVTAFLVGIAKKESSLGRFSPKKSGKDCYNYWGYKGSINPTSSGYSCFESPQQAVQVVGERLQKLIDQKLDTPEKLTVWKCGSSCASHAPSSVQKWIDDVSFYFWQILSV